MVWQQRSGGPPAQRPIQIVRGEWSGFAAAMALTSFNIMSADRISTPEPAALNQQWFSVQSSAEFIEASPHLNHSELRQRFYSLARQAFQAAAALHSTP